MSIRTHIIAAVGRASEGQTIAWIGQTAVALREDFVSIADAMGQDVKVRRTNGSESFEFPNGGRIWFMTMRRGRGFVCDRLYVPDRISDDDLLNLSPSVMTSKDGAVIYY